MGWVASVTIQNIDSVEFLWRRQRRRQSLSWAPRQHQYPLDRFEEILWLLVGESPQPHRFSCGGQAEVGAIAFFMTIPTTMVTILGTDSLTPETSHPFLLPGHSSLALSPTSHIQDTSYSQVSWIFTWVSVLSFITHTMFHVGGPFLTHKCPSLPTTLHCLHGRVISTQCSLKYYPVHSHHVLTSHRHAQATVSLTP